MGYRQVGKPTDFDSVIRRFESCYPIQFLAPAKNWMSRRSLSEGGLTVSHHEPGRTEEPHLVNFNRTPEDWVTFHEMSRNFST